MMAAQKKTMYLNQIHTAQDGPAQSAVRESLDWPAKLSSDLQFQKHATTGLRTKDRMNHPEGHINPQRAPPSSSISSINIAIHQHCNTTPHRLFFCQSIIMRFSLLSLLLLPAVLAAPVSDTIKSVLFPHYLVPIKQAFPNTAYPTQYTGQVSYTSTWHKDEIRLLAGFDVPEDAEDGWCAIKFTLAPKTSPYGYQWTVNGSGKLDVWLLDGIIDTGETSWVTKPGRTTKAPLFTIVVSTPALLKRRTD